MKKYDFELADRIREILLEEPTIEEKQMFGGICFMVNDKLCVCVRKTQILCRLDPEDYHVHLEKTGVSQMMHGKKPMNGYIYIDSDVVRNQSDLVSWINLALAYNQFSKAAPKKPRAK